jgi:hypothetical protein
MLDISIQGAALWAFLAYLIPVVVMDVIAGVTAKRDYVHVAVTSAVVVAPTLLLHIVWPIILTFVNSWALIVHLQDVDSYVNYLRKTNQLE